MFFLLGDDKKEVDGYFKRGVEKNEAGNYKEAVQDYTKAIELDPKYAKPYYFRGLCKIKLGEKESGCLDLSKAGELGYDDAYDKIKELCQ